MTTYFSFLFICTLLNKKKILISEVNFQCGSKTQKTPPFKKQRNTGKHLFAFKLYRAADAVL